MIVDHDQFNGNVKFAFCAYTRPRYQVSVDYGTTGPLVSGLLWAIIGVTKFYFASLL